MFTERVTGSARGYPLLRHDRCQHAVGHGGFHTGRVRLGTAEARYIYDCGTRRRGSRLSEEIGRYAASLGTRTEVNVLFISHLDSDHVNGVDELLTHVSVDTVVLPYVTASERVASILEEEFRAGVTATVVAQYGDTTTWLQNRGVRMVIYVRHEGGQSVAGPTGPEPVDGPTDIGPGGIAIDIPSMQRGERTTHVRDHKGPARIVYDNKPFGFCLGTAYIDWCFIPYVHDVPASQKTFRERVREQLGWDLSGCLEVEPERILSALRGSRRKLLECYREAFGRDLNKTSLSLYSGPFGDAPWRHTFDHPDRKSRRPRRATPRVGWLCPGDTKLGDSAVLQEFLLHYQRFLDRISTFVLPHHGSLYSYDPSLRSKVGAPFFTVTCPVSSRDHPHPLVEGDFSPGEDLFKVTSVRSCAARETATSGRPTLRRDVELPPV